jgi:hypothetical protein
MKLHKHSVLYICQRRQVLSEDEDKRKRFFDQDTSNMSLVCPEYTKKGLE